MVKRMIVHLPKINYNTDAVIDWSTASIREKSDAVHKMYFLVNRLSNNKPTFASFKVKEYFPRLYKLWSMFPINGISLVEEVGSMDQYFLSEAKDLPEGFPMPPSDSEDDLEEYFRQRNIDFRIDLGNRFYSATSRNIDFPGIR